MADRPTYKFDFGMPGVPPAPDMLKVISTARYLPKTPSGGTARAATTPVGTVAGWSVGEVKAYDYGGDPVLRDFCSSKDATFLVELPDGAYDVSIVSNDSKFDHYDQEFSLDGEVVASFGLGHTAPFKATYWHEVKGGALRVRLRDAKGLGGEAVLNALAVVPTDAPKPVPPTPWEASVARWRENMTTHGATVAAGLLTQDPATLDSFGDTYYDAARVFYQVADATKDLKWTSPAVHAARLYRDGYVFWDGNDGRVQGYWLFSRGLRMHHERTGDPRSAEAVLALARNGGFSSDAAKLDELAPVTVSREVAYAIDAHLDAEALGVPHRARTDELVAVALGHIEQWLQTPRTNPYFYVRPFMVGLTCESLIAYDAAYHDTRILAAVRAILDHIWVTCWLPDMRCFTYTDVATTPDNTGGHEPAPDLNLLICPAFAWVYKMTGEFVWKERADLAFMGGVDGTTMWDAKHYNQQYRWSPDYLTWRAKGDEVVPPPVPPPPPSPPLEPGLLPKARHFVITFPAAVPAGKQFKVDVARDGGLTAAWVP